MRTEFFQFLVQGKTGWLSRDFEKHAAGFTKINRMKIRAVDHWRHVVPEIDQMFAPLELFMLVLRSTRDVMHRTCSDAADTLWKPRSACSGGMGLFGHGSISGRESEAISSSKSPSGSVNRITSRPNRGDVFSAVTCCCLKRSNQ